LTETIKDGQGPKGVKNMTSQEIRKELEDGLKAIDAARAARIRAIRRRATWEAIIIVLVASLAVAPVFISAIRAGL
jgi:t-SNARE complex subunit (syntaxin)